MQGGPPVVKTPDMPTASDRDVRRRPGGRSAAVRSSVRRATIELLDEVGYDRLQIPDVAARAGVHKTTVYRNWPTKAHLVMDTVETEVAIAVPVPDTGNVHDDLVAYVTAITAVLRTGVARAVLRALIIDTEGDPDLTAARESFFAGRFLGSGAMIDRAIARGELPAGTDPLLLEVATSPIYFRLLFTGETVDDDLIHRLVRLALQEPPTSG